ncbi:energy transducer TonB [Cupriavidus malaysiensis]
MVRLKVGESGDVEYAAIEQSSSDARLDRAAVEAIARMRCRPADGSALPFRLPVTTVQPIDFELSQPAMTE